jgi:hypothetical protein
LPHSAAEQNADFSVNKGDLNFVRICAYFQKFGQNPSELVAGTYYRRSDENWVCLSESIALQR